MNNLQRKCRATIIISISLFIFCLSNRCDAAESVELYSGLRNKDFIKTGFNEHLYGVWSFEINAEYLIISGFEWNDWSGKVFGKYYYPHYTWRLWEKRFKLNEIETIITALNKAINWAKTSNTENVQNYKRDLVKLGQGISIYFNVSEAGKCSAVFRNDNWIFKDRIRDGGFFDRFIELSLFFDSNGRQDTVADMLNSLKNYKELHQKYVEEELLNRKLQLQKLDDAKKEKERTDKLFQ